MTDSKRMPAGADTIQAHPISLTEKAQDHLQKLKASKEDQNLLLRVGVRSGGCSGMSYVMDFESSDKIVDDDAGMPSPPPPVTRYLQRSVLCNCWTADLHRAGRSAEREQVNGAIAWLGSWTQHCSCIYPWVDPALCKYQNYSYLRW